MYIALLKECECRIALVVYKHHTPKGVSTHDASESPEPLSFSVVHQRAMLFLITGASGSGKTSCLGPLRDLHPEIAWHDFDELGVPSKPDKNWRHVRTELWVNTAVQYQKDDRDTGICGNIILGEVLASPSASQLNRVTTCLLDCYDVTRIDRLRKRGLHGDTQDMLCWAAWQRMHAADPQWRQDVIKEDGAPEMRWDRWDSWERGDPRWQVTSIDTTELAIDEVAAAVSSWINEERSRRAHNVS